MESIQLREDILNKIDEKVRPIVIALNRYGFKTSMSCQGHIGYDFLGAKVGRSDGYIRIDKVLNWRQKQKIKNILSKFRIEHCRFVYDFTWFRREFKITKMNREYYLRHGWELAPKRWAKNRGCPIRHKIFTNVFFTKL